MKILFFIYNESKIWNLQIYKWFVLNLKFKRWRTFDFVKKKIFLNFNTLQLQRCDLFISKLCIFFFIATNTFKAKCFFYLCLGYLNDFHFILVQFFVWIFHISTFADGVLQSGGTSFYYRLDGFWCFFSSKFTILWLSQYHVFFYSTNVLRLWQPLYTQSFFLFVQLDFGKNGGLFLHSWKFYSQKFCLKKCSELS